ncbi:hypothetical protein [Streptomyces sp. CRN 30]|uniref:hypothetical protein n=1 Tax=Streptomyces sp. CRN 30 TaxID=3075613 RepID=UPI002A8413D2|nr:hypothetical protein [Streptomyces sp. CRN 30]
MADSTNAVLDGVPPRAPATVDRTARRAPGTALLAAVAGAFTVAQLLLVRPGLGLGWDEIVYVSQVTGHTPAAFFSAPRSRGPSLLAAPVASWSSSTELLRVWFALLSGLGLWLALRAWRGLFPAGVLATGGALFATLWITLFYGPQAMPNYWVAVGALACVGCFLRVRADPAARGALWGVAGGAALMAWMRPTDAVYIGVPLLAVALWRRHGRLLLALAGGLATGGVEWAVEAYLWYGGLGERLHEASRVQGGLGWQIAVDDQLRSLGGRALCRPCTGSMPPTAVTLWWFALPLLAVLALAVAVRAGRAARTLLPLACAATAAFPYLFLIGYAAPRFLQPAYALLAIPVADGLRGLVVTTAGRWRPAVTVLAGLALAGHLAAQYTVLERTVDRTTASREDWARTADALHALGVRPPCLLTGHEAIPIAYYTGCSSGNTAGHNENTTPAAVERTARRVPVAALTTPHGSPPRYARDWTPHRIGDLRVLVAPR